MAAKPAAMGRQGAGRAAHWAGGLSIAAGAIHGSVAPEHFAEWWGYGVFFLFAATAQIVFGLALVTDAVNEADAGPRWRRLQRRVYQAGIVGNLLIMGLYVVTRTVGIPFFGPEAGQVEGVAGVDLLSKSIEGALVVLLLVLVRGSPERHLTPTYSSLRPV